MPAGAATGILETTMETEMTTPTGAPAALKGETTIEEPDRLQRAIARRAAEIRATIPDLEVSAEIDAAALAQRASASPAAVTAALVAASAVALRAHPRVNGAYRDGRYELYSRVNVAVMFATADAQIPATILDADERSEADLIAEVQRLDERVQAGTLTPPEQAGQTFTVLDLGCTGAQRATPLVVPPQAAGLVAGAIRPTPVVRDGAVVAGQTITLTVACDHRIVFPALAASFLTRIGQELERGG